MPKIYDAIVIGVGAMGAATCWQLARRGIKVLGLEQFDIPNTLGSSHGYSRLIRLAYFEHPDYVPLLRRAYQLWEEIERESGRRLLVKTGGLYLGRADSTLIAGSLKSAREHGLAHEMLDTDALAERFPQFQRMAGKVGFLEAQAGFLLPEKCVSTFAEYALRGGAEIHAREEVISWQSDGQLISVKTTAAEYSAKSLILCGGPWAGRLLRELNLRLRVSRQVMGWVWPKSPELFALGRFPIWALESDDGTVHYGTPLTGEEPGLKVARHHAAETTDPDTVNRTLLANDEKTFREVITRHLPQADGPLLASRVCLYTNTPDSHFILDHHPRHKNVHFAAGFSGHGFKFASVIGEIMADLCMHGSTPLPIKFMSFARFADDPSKPN